MKAKTRPKPSPRLCPNCREKMTTIRRKHYLATHYCKKCGAMDSGERVILPSYYREHQAVWATLFHDERGGCWNVEWGQSDGPGMPYTVVAMMSFNYLKKHKRLGGISDIRPGTCEEWGW